MKTKNIRQFILYLGIIMMLSLTVISCGKIEKGEETQTEEHTQADQQEETSLFLIVKHDIMEESLMLYSFETDLEYYYKYSFATQFKGKYGNFIPSSEFTPGKVVTIGKQDSKKRLTSVQLSDEVWTYESIHRFSIDAERGVFEIADSNYSIRDKVYIFSNGERITLDEISEDDILTVVGKEKKIISIDVTTGHGTLALSNTTLFEDSFLQLNDNIFLWITENMEVELPEGTYVLKVANDGWGGSTEVEIVRGETSEIDLDTLKGEGKQRGIVKFEIDVEDIKVYINNELIDHTQPVELPYGTHQLKIKATGYETWEKYLSVNSPEATIEIELTEEEQEPEDTEKDSEKEPEKDSEKNSEKDSEKKPEKDTEKNSEKDSENNTEKKPEKDTEKDSEKPDTEKKPEKDTEKDSEKPDTEKKPEKDTEKDSEKPDTEKKPEKDTEKDSEKPDTEKKPEKDTEKDSEKPDTENNTEKTPKKDTEKESENNSQG